METAQMISELMRQAYDGENAQGISWHGPSIRRLLEGVTAPVAAFKAIENGHSIWELVLHIAQWDGICARRLAGADIRMTTGDPEDWPAMPPVSEDSWNATLKRLRAEQEHLISTVKKLSDRSLVKTVPGYGWSNYVMVHGTLHHDLYHAGQIAVLRRAIGLKS